MIKNSREITTNLYLDTRREKKDGTYPLKLRVTHQRKSVLYPTKYSLTEDDLKKATGEKPRGTYKDLKLEFAALENKAIAIIDSLSEFSFETFNKRFSNKSSNLGSVISTITEHVASLKEKERFGDAGMYDRTGKSLINFYTSDKLRFENITTEFLEKYEKWMISKGRSLTTVGMYARCTRRLYRKAIKEGLVKEQHYPFGKKDDGKYTIPQPRNIKKALNIADIKKIFECELEPYSSEKYYRDIWLFSYLGNGINIKDICLLKYKHYHGENIIFNRAKTINTNRNSKPIVISLININKNIITEWGNKPIFSDKYIFPVLDDRLTKEKQQEKIRQFTKQVNKYMKRIAQRLDINTNITTYTARHSFATILKRSGVSMEYISESLGHTSLETTENYLDSFENETRKVNTEKLINF
jgi:integrase